MLANSPVCGAVRESLREEEPDVKRLWRGPGSWLKLETLKLSHKCEPVTQRQSTLGIVVTIQAGNFRTGFTRFSGFFLVVLSC
jgi:hypothetical protein